MTDNTQGEPPKTTRYFYTDPLAAVWMREHFGMELLFTSDDGELCSWDCNWFHLNGSNPAKLYLHPDSLHLLEPIAGDLVTNLGIAAWRVLGIRAEALLFADACFARKAEVEVIQRGGKPFHWPHSE